MDRLDKINITLKQAGEARESLKGTARKLGFKDLKEFATAEELEAIERAIEALGAINERLHNEIVFNN